MTDNRPYFFDEFSHRAVRRAFADDDALYCVWVQHTDAGKDCRLVTNDKAEAVALRHKLCEAQHYLAVWID